MSVEEAGCQSRKRDVSRGSGMSVEEAGCRQEDDTLHSRVQVFPVSWLLESRYIALQLVPALQGSM